MLKEIEKEIAETNAFTERLKELNRRLEILLENERQKNIKRAAELDKLEREINDMIFDQVHENKEPENSYKNQICRRYNRGMVTGLVCFCPKCTPYAHNHIGIQLCSGQYVLSNTRPSADTEYPIG